MSRGIQNWIFEENLLPWLEILARISKYELDPDEVLAFEHGLQVSDSEQERWFEYEFNDVSLKLARDPGSGVLSFRLDVPAPLVPRLETATEIAQTYRLNRRSAG